MHVMYNRSKTLQAACRIEISAISSRKLKEEHWCSSANSDLRKPVFTLKTYQHFAGLFKTKYLSQNRQWKTWKHCILLFFQIWNLVRK